jgi:hypothetical protein
MQSYASYAGYKFLLSRRIEGRRGNVCPRRNGKLWKWKEGCIMSDWQMTCNTTLVPADPARIPQWPAGEDFDRWLARCGYDLWSADFIGLDLGMEHATGSFTTYAARDADMPWQYVVSLQGPCQHIWHIWLSDAAAWLAFVATYAPGLAALVRVAQEEYQTQIASKAFHATHGHDATGCCTQCDPEGYAEWQKVLQGVQARRRSTAA